jgi:hypothetical protein
MQRKETAQRFSSTALGWVRANAVYCAAVLFALLTIALFYPGYMSPDSVEQLRQARFGVTSNAYPPLMAYIWRVTDTILPGPAGMLVLQNAVFWTALAGMARLAVSSTMLQIVFVAIAGFWPPTFCTLGTVWKDVGMQAFLLMGTWLLLLAYKRERFGYAAGGLVALFVACGFRHNAIAGVIPLIGLAVWVTVRAFRAERPRAAAFIDVHGLRRVQYAAATVFCFGLVWIPTAFVYSFNVQDARLYTGALIHDLVGISIRTNIDYVPYWSKQRSGATLAEYPRMFSPLHVNALYLPEARPVLGVPNPLPDKTLDYRCTEDQARALRAHWFAVVLDNAGSYVTNRLHILERLLVLPPHAPWYPYLTGIDPNPFGLVFERSRVNAIATEIIRRSAFEWDLFDAWIYYLLLVGCGIAALFYDFEYRTAVLVLVASGLLYFVSIALAGMSGDFRYNIWPITCSYVAPMLLARGRGGTTARDRRDRVAATADAAPALSGKAV